MKHRIISLLANIKNILVKNVARSQTASDASTGDSSPQPDIIAPPINHTFDIFGSCISRDIFEYLDAERYRVGHYIARQSIISSVSSSLAASEEDIDLSSSFQRKSVLSDLNKTAYKLLQQSHGDYLIIDFFEERFPLYRTQAGSLFTCSSELQKSGYLDKVDAKRIPYELQDLKGDIDGKPAVDYLETACSLFSKTYPVDRIIVNRAFLTDRYYDADGTERSFDRDVISYNQRVNNKMAYLYDMLEQLLGAPRVLRVPEGKYLGDACHKWGLASTHFEKAYYEDIAQQIASIVK